MIEVVLDTNVLVAAILKPDGEHAAALTEVVDNPGVFNLVVSSQIIDEYRDVLGRSVITLRGLKPEADALLGIICEIADEVVPKSIPELVYPDVKDKPFLEAAVYVNGLLVTNNVRDFPFAGVRILRAGEFVRFARSIR